MSDWLPFLGVLLLLVLAIAGVVGGIVGGSIAVFIAGLVFWALFLLAIMHG